MSSEPGKAERLTGPRAGPSRSEEHTSELQSLRHVVCRLLLEKIKPAISSTPTHESSASDLVPAAEFTICASVFRSRATVTATAARTAAADNPPAAPAKDPAFS